MNENLVESELAKYKEEAKYYKSEFGLLSIKYSKMVKEKNKKIKDLEMQLSKSKNKDLSENKSLFD